MRSSPDRDELHVVGDFAWDVVIQTDDALLHGGDTFGEIALRPGGSAANVAVWAARCGTRTHFIGKVGRDALGRLAHDDLAAEGVIGHLVDTADHPTGAVAAFVDHTGERSMVSGHGADHYLQPVDLPAEELSRARHLHVTGWSFFVDPPRSAARAAVQAAREVGATVSFDPSSFQLIERLGVEEFLAITAGLGVDIVFPNRDEAIALTGSTDVADMARGVADLYDGAVVIVKLDVDGAFVVDGDTAIHIEPVAARPVDTTGAGDSFAGAFLARRLAGDDVVTAARFATGVAAWVIEHVGARPRGDEDLDRLLGHPGS